jgi:hypothetical protein
LLPGDLAEKFDMAKGNSFTARRRPSKVANLAAYLVSDFSAYVGEVVVIDGGEWLKVLDNSICKKLSLKNYGINRNDDKAKE